MTGESGCCRGGVGRTRRCLCRGGVGNNLGVVGSSADSSSDRVRQRAVIWYIRIVFFCVLTNRLYSYTIKKPMKPDNNEDTVELESDDESEQEYYVIDRPDEDPQNNTNSDAHHVDSDQARTINFTDDVMLKLIGGFIGFFLGFLSRCHLGAGFISFGFSEFSSSGRNPIGRRRFPCNVLFLPSPFSR
jgi:hypothetical protein